MRSIISKEKLRILNLCLYGSAIVISLITLYTFIFVFNNGIGWKIFLIIVGICWLLSTISGFIKNLDNKDK